MDWNNFAVNTLENVIASLPQLFIVITTVTYSLSNIKNLTATFPKSIDNTKKDLELAFDDTKNILTATFDDAVYELRGVLNEAVDDISQKVNLTLANMQTELKNYREELLSTRNQTNMLVKENKVFMDVIAELLSKDPNAVKKGISTSLVHKVNMTKAELEKFPEQLITDLPILEKALSEARVVIGEEKIDALLKTLGYERKKL